MNEPLGALVLMVLVGAPDAGPKIIGEYYGVPIPEQGPWTKTLPDADGSLSTSGGSRSSTSGFFGPGSINYESDSATLKGTARLTLAKKVTGSPKLHAELRVKSGRVRIFLRYIGDIYFYAEGGPGQTVVLEGGGIQGSGGSVHLRIQALDGAAELEAIKVYSLK